MENSEKLLSILRRHFQFHAAILFGSRATGRMTPESDYDLLLIKSSGPRERRVFAFEGIALDVVVLSQEDLGDPAQHTYLYASCLLLDEFGAGAKLLGAVKQVLSEPPKPMPLNRKYQRKKQTLDFLRVIRTETVVGNYRRHWLLTNLLLLYFELRQEWFLGDKHALEWLAMNRPEVFSAFQEAFEPGAPVDRIEELIECVFDGISLE